MQPHGVVVRLFLTLLPIRFLPSFASFAALYWGLYGASFGIGLAALILTHELGHFIEDGGQAIAAA